MTIRFSIHIFRLLIIFILFIALFFSVINVFAKETPEQVAQKYGITFPIAELGGCTDYSACRTYCEDPVNYDTCIDFAKKKGFYKEEQISSVKQDFWAKTKAELGCDSETSCRQICEQEENFDRCNNFAQKYDLQGGHTEDPSKTQILEKAKEVLGCNSYASCSSFCQQEANRQRCSDFAKQVGLRGGEQHVGPGGCTTEETCKAFCSDPNNYQICSQYTSAAGGNFQGPGGCNSETSCRSYCEQNPQECRQFGASQGGPSYNPQEICSKTPNCSWTNNACVCSGNIGGGDYEKFCKENPDKCSGSVNPEEYCKQYPDRCSGNYPAQNDPQPSSEPYSYPSYAQEDPATQCAKYPGCSWTGTSCQCLGTNNNYQPPSESSVQPTSGVQGVATSKGLFQTIKDFLFGWL